MVPKVLRLLALTLVACAHGRAGQAVQPSEAPAANLAWREVAAPSDDAMPARPPFVAPGEQMIYRVALHGVEVASFSVVAGDVVEVAGRRAVVVQSGVQTSGVASLVRQVADTFTSWIDVATGQPALFRAEEQASANDPAHEAVETRFHAAADGGIPVSVQRGADEQLESQAAATAMHDLNSFLILLRGWDASPGSRAVLDVMRSRYAWRTQVSAGGYETVVTALGEMPALRFDGVSRRLTRAGGVDEKADARRYSVWISDDADRVPVLLVAHTDYGDIRMEIVDYRPGQRGRLGEAASGARLGEAPAASGRAGAAAAANR
jgi:hypothetical protein